MLFEGKGTADAKTGEADDLGEVVTNAETAGRAYPKLQSLKFRSELFLLFFLSGLSILATVLLIKDDVVSAVSQITLAAIFLLASLVAKRRERFERYWEVFFAFFVFTVVIVIRNLAISPSFDSQYGSSINGQILIQLVDTLSVIIPIIALTKISGRSLSSIYVKKGNLKLGLITGLGIFVIFYIATLGGFQLIFASSGRGLSLTKFLSLTPVLLVLVLLNGPREELWFRGLFLGKYEPLLGRRMSNLLQAPIFAVAHYNHEYAQFGFTFLVSFVTITFLLGVGLGYLMQRTDGLLGPSLAHAGADVGIYLAIILPLSS